MKLLLTLAVVMLCFPVAASQRKARRPAKPAAAKPQPTPSAERIRELLELAEPIDEWKQFNSDRYARFLYNRARISKTSKGTKKIWIKEVPRPERGFVVAWQVQEMERRKRSGESAEGYDQISHILTLYEFDCDKSQMRTLATVDYKADGTVLGGWTMRGEGDWDVVVPDSLGESFFDLVCPR